jgi:hypothetical protein
MKVFLLPCSRPATHTPPELIVAWPWLAPGQSQSHSHVTSGGQSASLSRWRATSGVHDKLFITVRPLRVWQRGSFLSDLFQNCCWPLSEQLVLIRVQWKSWQYITVSESIIHQPGELVRVVTFPSNRMGPSLILCLGAINTTVNYKPILKSLIIELFFFQPTIYFDLQRSSSRDFYEYLCRYWEGTR